ncbi:DUF6165 family protein [Undibacterium fentianense]|uniref:Uncharacterized protein n=1 Tax=Undibacterium fentianense TaxID=2828728 RepID=A0A941E6N8_9BURK|nr:DUF6165 family protein [Undibacterium fentianense]MBR7801539.1 hypothetical protein [Undibacterium fentianense]
MPTIHTTLPAQLKVPVSMGEFYDKLSILQLKQRMIHEADKRQQVELELNSLLAIMPNFPNIQVSLQELLDQLDKVNEAIWLVEDAIRVCERQQEFDAHFIALARAVYTNNDQRARIKNHINQLTGSTFTEVKSHQEAT